MQVNFYNSTLECIKHTYKAEGISGFYRGIIPIMTTVSFFRSISFSTYNATKSKLLEYISNITISSFISGAYTGAAISVVSSPIEFIKVQKQLERLGKGNESVQIRNSYNWMKYIIQQKGLLGLFSGYHLHLAREVMGTAVYFSVYDTIKSVLKESKPWAHMLAGGLAGSICWIVLFPIDITKSVYQKRILTQDPIKNTSDWIRNRYKTLGLRGFYQGIGPQMMRAFPVHSIHFLVYEYVVEWCRSI